MAMPSTISFLSDYGLVDEFVGVVKAVIRQLAPDTGVIDISHDIHPHDVRAGSLTLVRAIQYLPDGVVLAIVDPGVGTARRAIAVEAGDDGMILVGPDNGLMAPAAAILGGARRAVSLTNTSLHLSAAGPTFAGRDILAPVAAYLATGVDLEEFGPRVEPVTLLPGIVPLSRSEDGAVIGEALWVDRFGNVQLNIDPDDVEFLGDVVALRFGTVVRTAVRARTYGDLRAGQIGLVVDSYGLLSVCLDRANASVELGLGTGSAVTLDAPDDDPGSAPGGLTTAAGAGAGRSTPVQLRATRP